VKLKFDNWFDAKWHPFFGFSPAIDLGKSSVIACLEDPWQAGGVCDPHALFNLARIFYNHTFIVFTDYPAAMRTWVTKYCKDYYPFGVQVSPCEKLSPEVPFRNLCLGVKINNQAEAGERLNQLRLTPAALRGVAYHAVEGVNLFDLPCSSGNMDAIRANFIDFAMVYAHPKRVCDLRWITKFVRQLTSGRDRFDAVVPDAKPCSVYIQNLSTLCCEQSMVNGKLETIRTWPQIDPFNAETWPLWLLHRDRIGAKNELKGFTAKFE